MEKIKTMKRCPTCKTIFDERYLVKLPNAEKLFDGCSNQSIDEFTRPDAIGGNFYIRLERDKGRVLLSIGSYETEETHIKIVESYREVQMIAGLLS